MLSASDSLTALPTVRQKARTACCSAGYSGDKNHCCKQKREAYASRFALIDQVIFLGKRMCQVFKHVKHGGAFRGRQALFIKEVFAAENQHAISLLYAGGFNACQGIFMSRISLFASISREARSIGWVVFCIIHSLNSDNSLRRGRFGGKFSL